MTIELANARAIPKPWGIVDLRPWNIRVHDGTAIGEIWYERPGNPATKPSLLLKILLTNEPLSIQVLPDDAYAYSIGLASGKTEAWYVLSAAPGAKVALGLDQQRTPQQLRQAAQDGSISELVVWRTVSACDVIFVPPGTIHAIGTGLVIAEVQQNSDATLRLFDHGRKRELDMKNAVAVANAGPADSQSQPVRPNDLFVIERVELAPGDSWCLAAKRETWLLILSGSTRAGSFNVATADTVFAQCEGITIHVGPEGVVGLVAYTGLGGPIPEFLQRLSEPGPADVKSSVLEYAPPSLTSKSASPAIGFKEAIS